MVFFEATAHRIADLKFEIFALVIDRERSVIGDVFTELRVCQYGIVSKSAFGKLIGYLYILMSDFTSPVAGNLLFQAMILRSAIQIGCNNVPGNSAFAEMVDSGESVNECIEFPVCQAGSAGTRYRGSLTGNCAPDARGGTTLAGPLYPS